MVDLLTEDFGRISVLAKGARAKRSMLKGVLQPFTPLLLRWSGRGDLKILTKAEPAAIALPLQNVALYSGFYLNELICRVEPALRTFEFQLLRTLGYGIDFTHCAGSGKAVEADMTYRYREEKGFIASLIKDNLTFYGRELLAFEQTQFDEPSVLSAAKRFTRIALKPYLGDKPLKCRELFTQHSLYSK